MASAKESKKDIATRMAEALDTEVQAKQLELDTVRNEYETLKTENAPLLERIDQLYQDMHRIDREVTLAKECAKKGVKTIRKAVDSATSSSSCVL